MRFVKAQTNGNDFIIILRKEEDSSITGEIAKLIADRYFGVGCDQVMELTKITDTRYNINFFNADGGRAEMCGNGICAASLFIGRIILSRDRAELNFTVSDREYRTTIEDEEVTLFTEKPIFLHKDSEYQILSTGNRHLVCNMKMVNLVIDLKNKFPECNIHFIECIDEFVRMKTFERGVGWTKACGSGALAVATSQNLQGSVKIIHDGGTSIVRSYDDNRVSLTVRPKLVFSGDFYDAS
ncbi:MAG: diaminopimelate epimerase [Holosporales bacterium]|jgi:diaminopimelate epimerase|nr:diaminopimelate epimerase [Holosporales bacterium]